jgi:uncharacterized protein YfaP (DUF2135 family)
VALALAIAGCGPARTAAPPPSAAAHEGEGLLVTLLWDAPVDLDLYVTTPLGETVYYANPHDAFVRDSRCSDALATAHVEEARWRRPAPGRYRIGVDFPEACTNRTAEAAYRVVVDADGRREDRTGTARLLVRNPAVLEVVVP